MQAFESKPPPLIESPDGSVRVTGSRVSLETVVGAFDAGSTAEEIAQQYPSLSLGSIYAVVAYILENRVAVDRYLAGRRQATGALQGEIEASSPPNGLRARLLGAAYESAKESAQRSATQSERVPPPGSPASISPAGAGERAIGDAGGKRA